MKSKTQMNIYFCSVQRCSDLFKQSLDMRFGQRICDKLSLDHLGPGRAHDFCDLSEKLFEGFGEFRSINFPK